MLTNPSIAQAATNAASTGVQQAVTTSAPDAFFRAFNRVFHPETTLRGTDDIEIFNTLRAELLPLCLPNDEGILPPQVIDCWKVFFFQESRGPVYTFTGVPDLKKCKEYYATYTPIEGRVRQDFPLTGSILGILSAITSIAVNAKQNVAKIALGYIGLVSLTLTELDSPVQQYEVTELLKKVTDILINGERYRGHFDNGALAGLRELSEVLKDFLSLPHPTRDCEVLPRAMKRFQRYQLSIILKMFQTLFVLTEGGNKPSLTTNLKRVAGGLLEDGSNTTTFDPDNPFQAFLQFVASSLEALHTQYVRKPITEHVEIPSLQEIEDYLRKSLKKGTRFAPIGTGRQHHAGDSVLYLLEQKAKDDGSQEVIWASGTDEAVIKASAQHLRRIADWLRFHLYIGDKVVDMNAVMSMEGQSWLAQGEEAEFVRHFIGRYQEMLLVFQRETGEAHAYLSRAIRTDMGSEHGVMKMLSSGLSQNVTCLMEHGLKPLLHIDDRFTCLVGYIQEIRRRIFTTTAGFLNASGYGFSLRYTAATEEQATTTLTTSRNDANKALGANPAQALLHAARPDTVSAEKIEKVKNLLLGYAKTHGYIQESSNGTSPLQGKNKMHQVRAEWIQSILNILNSSKIASAIVFEVAGKIWELKESENWSHFTQRRAGKTEIQECIAEIERVLFNKRMQNPLLHAFAGETDEAGAEMDTHGTAASINTTPANVTAFRRHDVKGDGDCGYTSFGIERLDAHQLLSANISSITTLLQPAVQEALLTDAFYVYLVSQNATPLTHDQIESQLEHCSTDPVIASAYIDYDVLHKKIDKGWAHPSVLQALSDIQKIELYLWYPIQRGSRIITPYQNKHADFAHHCPVGATQRLDLAFVNNNHFERLDPTGRGERPDYVVKVNEQSATEVFAEAAEHGAPPSAPDKQVVILTKPLRLKPHFVYHLNQELVGLTAIHASSKKRADFLEILAVMVGLTGRQKKFAAVQATELRAWRYEQAKQYLRGELLAAYSREGQSKESAQQFLLGMHPKESELHRVRSVPEDLTPYRGKYLFVTETSQLFYVDQQLINTGVRDASIIERLFGAHASTKMRVDALMGLIESHGGHNPMLDVVKAKSRDAEGIQASGAYEAAKTNVLTSRFSGNSWLASEASREYRSLVGDAERLLQRTMPADGSRMTSQEFLMDIKRHLLLDFMNRDESFEEESFALDDLLAQLMDAFSSMPVKGVQDEQERRAFYQEVVRHIMGLGASPLRWMRAQREKARATPISADESRGYLLVAQQVKLILSHLEHRAHHLGETVLLLGDKFKRLLKAVENFAEHLYACAGDEDEWVWNRISRVFDLPDGARLERTTLFWCVLELIYTMLNEGLSLNEDANEELTPQEMVLKGEKVRGFQEQQRRFKVFAESYIKKVRPELFGCALHVVAERPPADKCAEYQDSYLFCKAINARQLYYVHPDSTLELVRIGNFSKFETELSALKKKPSDTLVHLTEEQIAALVTENGGHTWSLRLDEQVMTQILPPFISHRNYGRRTFVELFRAYSDVEGEFERLAEVRQHGREIFNAARMTFQSREELAAANQRADDACKQKEEECKQKEEERKQKEEERKQKEEERKQKEEERKQKEEERKQKEEERKQKEEERKQKEEERKQKEEECKQKEDAIRRHEESRQALILHLLSTKLSANYFQPALPAAERRVIYGRQYSEILVIVKAAFGQTISALEIEKEVLRHLRGDEYSHIRDLVPPEVGSAGAGGVTSRQSRYTMYSPRDSESDSLHEPLLGQRQRQ